MKTTYVVQYKVRSKSSVVRIDDFSSFEEANNHSFWLKKTFPKELEYVSISAVYEDVLDYWRSEPSKSKQSVILS